MNWDEGGANIHWIKGEQVLVFDALESGVVVGKYDFWRIVLNKY